MATVTENLRAYLLDDEDIADSVVDRIGCNVPESGDTPFIFMQLTGTDDAAALDDTEGLQPASYTYALECWATTNAEATDLANLVKAHNLHAGEFGDMSVQCIWFENAKEDYVSRLDGSEINLQGVFLEVYVVPVLA